MAVNGFGIFGQTGFSGGGDWQRSTDGGVTLVAQTFPGGALNHIWIDERDGTTMMAVSNNTSVRTSTDGGDNWTLATGVLPRSIQGGCIRHRSTGVLIAGLINNNNGLEVARSTDSGANWSVVQVSSRLTSQVGWKHTPFHEANDGSLLAIDWPNAGLGDFSQVYRSTNQGSTWSVVLTGAAGQGCISQFIGDGVLLALIDDNVNSAAVHRSTNNGVTWSSVLSPAADFFELGHPVRTNIAKMPNGNLLLLGKSSVAWVSTDNGATWAQDNSKSPGVDTYGCWAGSAAVWSARDIVGGRLFRSLDNAASWTNMGTGPGEFTAYSLASVALEPAVPVGLGLEIAPPRFNPIREVYPPIVRIY